MKTISSNRRQAAAICAGCAAVIPSATLLMGGSHSGVMDFAGGLTVGGALTLSIATLIRSRRRCDSGGTGTTLA